MPGGLGHDAFVADLRVIEAHRRVIDEGPVDVGEIHFLDQLVGRAREAEDARAIGAERAIAVEELQLACGRHFAGSQLWLDTSTVEPLAHRLVCRLEHDRIAEPLATVASGLAIVENAVQKVIHLGRVDGAVVVGVFG